MFKQQLNVATSIDVASKVDKRRMRIDFTEVERQISWLCEIAVVWGGYLALVSTYVRNCMKLIFRQVIEVHNMNSVYQKNRNVNRATTE